jgi:hypothetical protein
LSLAPSVQPDAPEAVLYEEPTVRLFGRTLPKANVAERVAWSIVFVGLVTIFSVATQLTPDRRGIGTHEQIPLIGGHMPPCGFVAWSQQVFHKPYPCPSCGFTTTFAYAAHGQVWDAIKNQPFGFFVFCTFAALVPVSLLCAIGQVSPLRWTDHWRWKWILGALATFWLLAWFYKMRMLTG